MTKIRRDHLSLLESLETPVWVFDLAKMQMVWANGAALELWGAPNLGALIARDYSTGTTDGTRRRLDNYARKFERGERVTETWNFYPESKEHSVEALCTCSGVALEDEAEAGFRPVMLVEAREVSRADPNAAERRLVEALRHCTEMISFYSLDGELLLRNPAAEESLRNMPIEESEWGSDLARGFRSKGDLERLQTDLEHDRVFHGECEMETTNGPAWHDVEARIAHDPSSGDRVVLVYQHDVTARKRSEEALERNRLELERQTTQLRANTEQLERARLEAESANRAKSDFLAMMSHELRTPMTGVLTAMELLAKTNLNTDQSELVEMSRDAGGRLVELIDDVLDLSKIEAGQVHVVEEPFSPAHLVRTTVNLLAGRANESGIRIDVATTRGVPEHVRGDRRRTAQVLTNLLANAIKFSSGGTVEVTLRVAPRPGWLRFEISDEGPGFDPERIASLFEPFVQLDASRARRFDGSGLGLSIAKKLCVAMGGDIDVQSEEGRGSVFAFSLPLAETAQEENRAPESRSALESLHGLRVLVVDDHPVNLRAFGRVLRSWGCAVLLANSGKEALTLSDQEHFDAVLMDVQMPELDGVETTRAMRRRPLVGARTPVFALTADVFFERSAEYTECAFHGFIPKPVNWSALQQSLLDVIQTVD